MRESSFQLAMTGLRPRERDIGGMELLQNILPRDGYWEIPPGWDPYVVEGAEFPFPQLFRGEAITFLCIENRIGILNETLQALSWLPITIVDGGGPWHFCDWGDGYIFSNNADTVYCLRSTESPYDYTTVAAGSSVFQCCANHKGRLLYGNDDTVSWSSMNADDAYTILAGKTRSDTLKKMHEFGSLPPPFRGTILAIHPLGTGVAVYWEDGVCLIEPNTTTRGYDPVFIAGLPPGVGLSNTLAVRASEYQHIFLGSDGSLYLLTPNAQVERLRYSEFLGGLSAPTFSVGPNERDVWIVDASTSYCLTRHGLGGPMDLAPYSAIRLLDGTVLRTGRSYESNDAVIAKARSPIFDFGESGRQRVTVIQVGSRNLDMWAGVDTRFNTTDNFIDAFLRPCNAQGWAVVRTQGTQIKAVFLGRLVDHSVAGEIHRAEVRYQLVDKRGRRGTKILGAAGRVSSEE